MRITHQKIADELGVSRVTVTQALHGTRGSNLRPELRRKVQRAALRLGYQPRNRTTHTIGVVMPTDSMNLAGENRLLMLTDQALHAVGYRLTIASVREGHLEALRETLTPKNVDGVLFNRWFGGRIKDLLPPEVPWLLTSDEDGVGPEVDVITVDTLAATEILAKHLLSFGHKRICLVTGPGGLGFHERQKAGVCTALSQAELPESNLKPVEVQYDHEIAALLLPLLRGPSAPTAIIGAGAEKTVAVLNLLCREGYCVPEDISVVSLMDHTLLEPLIPSITTTTFGEKVAEIAVSRLMEMIHNPELAPQQVLVPAQLIERQSVAPPRAVHARRSSRSKSRKQ